MAFPAVGFASEVANDPVLPTTFSVPASQSAELAAAKDDLLILDTSRLLAEDSALSEGKPFPAQTAFADPEEIDAELECMAKVVHHEAANQSRRGQLAVAQLIMNRMESGRFPNTICGVANQPGQFFNTASYNPKNDTARWQTAIEVAREARDGSSERVMPKAIFYHAAYQAPTKFFRTRPRVAALGDHIFYR